MSCKVNPYINYALSTILDENQESKKQEIHVFDNPQYGRVRMVMRKGEPWFVAKDVCACLGLTNTSKAVSTLEEGEKGITNSYTLGGDQDMLIVSEPGLYDLVGRSRKPDAKAFWHWVRHEVLVSIRKTGFYSRKPLPSIPELVANPDLLIALAIEVKELKATKAVEAARANYEAARAELAIATKGQIVQGRDQRLMQQRHEDIKALNRKDERNGKLEAMYAEQGIELGAEKARADKAEDAIGVGKTYRCAINIPWFKDYFDFKNCKADLIYKQAGKQLKALSDEMGYSFVIVPGHKFDVKAYHIDVIASFRLRLDANPSLMERWRKKD